MIKPKKSMLVNLITAQSTINKNMNAKVVFLKEKITSVGNITVSEGPIKMWHSIILAGI